MNDKLSDIHFDEAVSQRKLFLESNTTEMAVKIKFCRDFTSSSLVVRSKASQLYSQANEDWNRLLH